MATVIMESRKRKREINEPRIKYHVEQSGRSFERILKENSREELCEVVRKKLDLDSKTNLELSQIREGVVYDLEDDEDFEAFKSAAYAYSSLDVRVSYTVDAIPKNVPNDRAGPPSLSGASTSSPNPQGDRHKEAGQTLESIVGQTTREHSLATGASFDVDGGQSVVSKRSNRMLSSASEETAAPREKRRKKDHADLDPTTSAEGPKRKKTKVKESDVSTLKSVVPAEDVDQRPLRKKQKLGKKSELEASGSPVDESQTSTADPSYTANAKLKKTKSKTTLADTPDTSTEASQVKKRKSTKKSSAMAPTSVKATSDSTPAPVVTHPDPPSRLAQADPGASTPDSIRLTYASLLKRRQRTASEIAAEYCSRVGSQSRPQKSVSVVDDAATSTRTMAKVEIQKEGEGGDVEVVNDNKQGRHKPKLAKSRLSESWVPAETGEVHSSLSNKQLSISESSKVADVATHPQPFVELSHASHSIYSPKRGGPKQSPNAKLASPCPICLSVSFHLRFKCPVITSGADAITERIAQLKAEGGKEDLVEELREWLQKDRKKKRNNEAAQKETATHSKVSPPAAAQSKRQDLPLPPWAPVLSLQTHPSEVIVESTHEGSESATSSSSEQEDKSDSSTESSSVSGSRSMSPSVNLDHVDLESLIRGPSLKATPMELLKGGDENDEEEEVEESPDDDVEGDIDFLEEEEPLPKRSRGSNIFRSESPGTVDGDEDEDDSASEVEHDAAKETEPSVQGVTDGNGTEQDHGTTGADDVDAEPSVGADLVSHIEPAPTKTPEVVRKDITSEATSMDLVKETVGHTPLAIVSDVSSGYDEGVPHADRQSNPSASPSTTPTPSNAPPSKVVPSTPRTIRRMKDRHGRLLLDPLDEAGSSQPVPRSTEDAPEIVAANTQNQTLEETQQGRPSHPLSQPRSTAKQPLSLSDSGSPSRSQGPDIPSASQPIIKRGRPPLTDAVKAERKALKDAQKATKAAEKRAKAEQGRKPSRASRQPTKKPDKSVVTSNPSEQLSTSQAAITFATPVLTSQWTSLSPVTSSTTSPSSPAIDQLMSSSQSKQSKVLNEAAAEAPRSTPTSWRLDGIKSPGSVSLGSGSRKLDEEDVEQIVGTSEVSGKASTRTPLFLPGASQMSQSQVVPRFAALFSEETAQEAQQEHEDSPSGPSSDEGPSMPAISRMHPTSKSAFPSLSQLSFDKFKPSFLLTSVFSQSQNKVKDSGAPPPDGSESEEDDESSDSEPESHIPKGKRAGAGIIKRTKSRGLLH